MSNDARQSGLMALSHLYSALIPTETYVLIVRRIAEELRLRGLVDAANYLERGASTMEDA